MERKENEKEDTTVSEGIRKPYVFISHNEEDAGLARAFSDLLKTSSHSMIETFYFTDRGGRQGIPFGLEWFPALTKELSKATHFVCLLTENSINKPWILYEVGIVKGKLDDNNIIGLAVGIPRDKAFIGPFQLINFALATEKELENIVLKIFLTISGPEPDRETIRNKIAKFIDNKDDILKKRNGNKAESKDERVNDTVIKIFEEVKNMFAGLPLSIGETVNPKLDTSFQEIKTVRLEGKCFYRRVEKNGRKEL
jgi:TIR domain